MKIGISIPDRLFEAAELVAGDLAISRSELYARALDAYLQVHGGDAITSKLDRIYADHASGLDPVLERMQQLSLPPERW